MELCGPYSTLTPDCKQFFFAILDDHSNWGFTHLLCLKSEAFPSYCKTEAFLLFSFGTLIITVRLDGALELCKGILGDHFAKQGIVVQQTAPYAHQQAGKIERYVRTIEEGGQTLLADSGLPMSFWGWAVLTLQYLQNCFPTSTLSANTTPFEVMMGKKPDLSIWGCQCFPTILPELRTKAGPQRFEAIFIGYEEARIGWLVQDLKGAVHFSRDVIFNEDLSGCLGVPRSIISRPSSPILSPDPVSARPVHDCMLTMAGRDYANALCLKRLRGLDHEKQKNMTVNGGASDVAVDGVAVNGGDASVSCAVAADAIGVGGGVPMHFMGVFADGDLFPVGMSDLTLSDEGISDFISFLAPLDLPNLLDTDSLAQRKMQILLDHCMPSPSGPDETVASFSFISLC